MDLDNLKTLLSIDPRLITGVFVALGLKELLWKFVERKWAKEDEKVDDHKKLEELSEKVDKFNEKVDKIIETLDKMEENDKRSDENDMLMIGRQILDLQNRAIAKEKVSSACMPDYLEAYEHYMELAEKTGCKISEGIKINHVRILEMVKNGQVVETLKEWYK